VGKKLAMPLEWEEDKTATHVGRRRISKRPEGTGGRDKKLKIQTGGKNNKKKPQYTVLRKKGG